ncbi:unnamed protein product [Rhizophagus irregularis]|uniref:PARP catalytic domain-containing protein n=2 Tax=Rhizophagus irregularis TaxID=588596 RepID=A0A915YRJ5_9GLOM|nr:unnamed protein product [Rhizophagus irregularis]CAB4495680.1 unnamed protein product [Rhizophagus irregularis]CAB5176343.1 unnamed protein product [Rhizophagus irregularis]CAB5319280.1 unnamed protein product [Rhizophagus irregularis]CAB5388631.1 unnamed protein product [Rhizophagus irregularis]
MSSLTPLSATDPEYQNIISHFDLPPSSYVIHSILKIKMDWIYADRFDNAIRWAWKKPDTYELFHGTRHACNVWELKNSNKLCDNTQCGVCGILKFGNLLKMAKPNFAGQYLWFSPRASYVQKYTGPLKPHDDGFRAMFVVSVIFGKHYLKSIITEYEENVLPKYLIIYKGNFENFEKQEIL